MWQGLFGRRERKVGTRILVISGEGYEDETTDETTLSGHSTHSL